MVLARYPIRAGIPVTDLDRAIAWYREKLGFELAADPPLEPTADGVFLDAGAGTQFFLFPTLESPGAGHTLAEIAVGDDLDAVVDELRGRGVVFEEYDLPGLKTEAGIAQVQDAEGRGAHRVAFFKDFDGNILAIASHR